MKKTEKTKTTVSLVSLGCPKNLVDSEVMLAKLAEGGCVVGAPMGDADVIVINTCGFLAAAREESLGVIREALEHKQHGRTRRVVVAGCLANRDGASLLELAGGVDAVLGVNDRSKLLQAVTGKAAALRVTEYEDWRSAGRGKTIASDAGRFRLTPRHTAYLRIAEGCSQRCTFCAIPSIRGPFRSKPPRQVRREAAELVADGARELNLIAQDTTHYGSDLGGGENLAGLLESLTGLDVHWLRLLYAYPMRLTQGLIDTMARHGRIARYVDIPLQHISDGVLRRMGRRVTRTRTEDLLARLRQVEGLAIRTTFIVGFPGETDAQFEELLEFVEAFRFDALGVFEYSAEEGTPAARLGPAVPAEVKAERARRVMLAQRKIALAANRRRKGQTLEVLVDGVDNHGRCVGRHEGQAPDIDSLCVLTSPREAGEIITCRVTGHDGYDLRVEPVVEPASPAAAASPRRKAKRSH